MELRFAGASVWEKYTIEVMLEYAYGGDDYHARWTDNVGGWQMEMCTYNAPIHFF